MSFYSNEVPTEIRLTTISSELLCPDVTSVENALFEFDGRGGDDLLDGALADCLRAVWITSTPSDREQPIDSKWKMFQATALYLRFERDSRDQDIDEGESILKALVVSQDLSSSLRAKALYGLGRVYEAKYDRYSGIDFMKTSCDYYRQAMVTASSTAGFPDRLLDEMAVHLGRLLGTLNINERDFDQEDIRLISSVVNRTQHTHLKSFALLYLSITDRRKWYFSDRENHEDLYKSEERIRHALLLSPRHRHRYRFLGQLAMVSLDWETLDRVREGISLAKEAMALLTSIPPVRRIDDGVILTLAHGCHAAFTMEGHLSDLDDAIAYRRLFMSDLGQVSYFVPTYLCSDLTLRFKVTGRPVDIDHAIEAGQRALDCFSTDEYIPDVIRLNTGQAHLLRFASDGDVEDLEVAHVHFETGLQNLRASAFLPDFLRQLATLYDLQFDLWARQSDLNLAIDNGTKSVSLTLVQSIQDNEAPTIVSEQGDRLLKRYELKGKRQDLLDAAATQQNALQLASLTYSERHLILWRYGRTLRFRFEAFREWGDSEQCEELLQEALHVALTARLPIQSVYLSELGSLCFARFSNGLDPAQLDLSLGYYMDASHAGDGLPSDRFRASLVGARLAQQHDRVGQAAELFSQAVSFLPRIAWLGHHASKRHRRLVETASQLACDAAASAIKAQRLERAVELLDEGRSIIWRSILELRTDLEELQDVEPQLAKDLLEVAQFLEHDDLGTTLLTQKVAEERAAHRRRAAERWEELVGKVRDLRGFESFLRPLDYSVLLQAAQDGPVVLLNVSEYGSDALIVSSSEPIRHIPLSELDIRTVHRLAYTLLRALGIPRDTLGRSTLQTVLLDVSRQLWDRGLNAVAGALQSQMRGSSRRVWWIPAGLLSLLPVHCAGPYKAGQSGIPDLFISSYSTTLSSLMIARQPRRPTLENLSTCARMLVIGVPETPGFPALPSTRNEIELVEDISCFKGSSTILYGEHATLNAVTNNLSDHNWLHACCHGRLDHQHPLDSAFHLKDGTLTLAQISQMRLSDSEFAFLSACHSARHTVVGTDECMNMVAGLQVAGFRGVVGTAWSMADRDGPQLAERFYYWLTVEGRPPDARNAAEALHFAIKDMRAEGVPLYRWAAFVHFGI